MYSVGVWGDLLGVEEGAEFWFMILKQQSVQVERTALHYTVPGQEDVPLHLVLLNIHHV